VPGLVIDLISLTVIMVFTLLLMDFGKAKLARLYVDSEEAKKLIAGF
jgi:hypothetical protein